MAGCYDRSTSLHTLLSDKEFGAKSVDDMHHAPTYDEDQEREIK